MDTTLHVKFAVIFIKKITKSIEKNPKRFGVKIIKNIQGNIIIKTKNIINNALKTIIKKTER